MRGISTPCITPLSRHWSIYKPASHHRLRSEEMFKWVALIKRKRGMSRQAFIDHYENVHVPLLKSLLPPMAAYRRNYVRFDDPIVHVDGRQGDGDESSFDVITECIFANRDDAKAVMDAFQNPDILAR